MLKNGDVVYVSQRNIYLGSVRNIGDSLKSAYQLGQWERFVIETDGQSYGFKQQVSNLYLGGQVQEGANPQLVAHRKQWETFTLQKRGNGIAIKTFLNTYIVKTDKGIVCTNNFSNGNQIWNIIDSNNGASLQLHQEGSKSISSQNKHQIKVTPAKILDATQFKYPSFSQFPNNGDRCYFHRGGLFIGAIKDLDTNVTLASSPNSYQKWIIETVGSKYALKQQVSGHYFGCDVRDNQSPRLASGRLANEQFTLQKRGKGIAFKSSMNTYLTQDGTLLKWKKSPKNGSQQFFVYYDQSRIQNQRYGFNLGNIFNFSNSNHNMPNPGQIFSLSQNNKYLSGKNQAASKVMLSDSSQQLQKFYFDVNQNGKTVAIRNVASGFYLGGQIHNNTSPELVSNRGEWEQLTIQSRGNGNLSICTRQNTYLTRDNDKLIWKSNVQIGKDIWNYRTSKNNPNSQPTLSKNNISDSNNPNQAGRNKGFNNQPNHSQDQQEFLNQQNYNLYNQNYNQGFQQNYPFNYNQEFNQQGVNTQAFQLNYNQGQNNNQIYQGQYNPNYQRNYYK